MKPFWVVLSVYQLTTDPIVKQSTLEQPKGVFLFLLRTSYDSNGVKSPAGKKRWAGLHLTASPVALSGDYTSYKDNGDRQPCIE
jgi:hypothetical protein